MPRDEGHVLGVDGGGSATRCVIAHTSGRVVARGSGGPSNHLTVGLEEAAGAIKEAVEGASEMCGVRRFRAACLGLAGVDRPSGREAVRSKLSKVLPCEELIIVSDAAAALAGATGCRPGVAVIAGTGSIAYGLNEQGESARSGGWGWMVGDEGSGYDIGRKAITASLRAQDGRAPPTGLVDKLKTRLGLADIGELIDRIYPLKMGSQEVSALAPLVGEAAGEGDLVAEGILREAGAELGLAALSVIRRLRLKGGFTVAFTGGVFRMGPVKESFEEAIKGEATDCLISPPRFEPAVGSALIALQSLGIEVDDGLLTRLEDSLKVGV